MTPSRLHGSIALVSLAVCWHFNLPGPLWLFAGMWLAWFLDSWQAARWDGWTIAGDGKTRRK